MKIMLDLMTIQRIVKVEITQKQSKNGKILIYKLFFNQHRYV